MNIPSRLLRLESACLIAGTALGAVGMAAPADAPALTAVDYRHATIYHSPQTPGFTSWVGAWTMPDASIMITFTQATGPIAGKPMAPLEVQRQLDWPPLGASRGYDMTGLDLRNVHLRSTDSGLTWRQVSADAFKSNMNGITGDSEVALPDGTVVRGVWGHYLPYNPELPKTGYLQRSHDSTATWGPPEVLLDPGKYMTYPKRLRVLRDGRLILIGGIAYVPANSLHREEMGKHIEPLLLVSSDQGKTWEGPIAVVPAANRQDWGGEEYDAAELPNGDLLCVFRRPEPNNHDVRAFAAKAEDSQGPRREVRWQGVLRKQGATWVPVAVGPAPFPPSGHPELLATSEGVILHLATTGIHWTKDAGQTWHQLNVPGTPYYPRSVQARDGRIFVFGHVGGDDPYGEVDQSIIMDSFRLDWH